VVIKIVFSLASVPEGAGKMRFTIRAKETALADLRQKLQRLPVNHPDCATLARMIQDLGAEVEFLAKPAAMDRSVFQHDG
jgi:hypothetical protein